MAEKWLYLQRIKTNLLVSISRDTLTEASEYKDVESHQSMWRSKSKDGKGVVSDDGSFVIWTTTLDTSKLKLGVFVHPDYEYAEVKTKVLLK